MELFEQVCGNRAMKARCKDTDESIGARLTEDIHNFEPTLFQVTSDRIATCLRNI